MCRSNGVSRESRLVSPSLPRALLDHANDVVALNVDLAEPWYVDFRNLLHDLLRRGTCDAEFVGNTALIDQAWEQWTRISQDGLVHQRSLESSDVSLASPSPQKRAWKARWTAAGE